VIVCTHRDYLYENENDQNAIIATMNRSAQSSDTDDDVSPGLLLAHALLDASMYARDPLRAW
jgi:hypothetical protein